MVFEHAIVFEGGDGLRYFSEPICGNVLITLPRAKAVARVEVAFIGKIITEFPYAENEMYKYKATLIE